jgi:metal-sulfur cluster biosynthetic enzyme
VVVHDHHAQGFFPFGPQGGMSGSADRIAREEAKIVEIDHSLPAEQESSTHGTRDPENGDGLSNERVLEALKHVNDPELGINIVDLGLVYDVRVSPEGDVDIEYTLTTMGCPIGPLIEDQMRQFLAGVEGTRDVRPEMVLRPAWSPELMSEEAKAALGMF